MIPNLSDLPALAQALGPPLLSLLAASLAAAVLARRRPVPGLMLAAAAAAALLGWALLIPAPWRAALWPRSTLDHLLLPACVIALMALLSTRVSGRWPTLVAALFAAWWLAGSPAGRPEFYRVWFASLAINWALTRQDAVRPARAVATALTAWGGVLLAAGAPMAAAAMVLVTTASGMAVARRLGAVPPALSMLGIVVASLSSGRLVRGGVGLVDLACAGAIVAPSLMTVVERALTRRMRRLAPFLAPAVTAVILVAAAWVAARLIQR